MRVTVDAKTLEKTLSNLMVRGKYGTGTGVKSDLLGKHVVMIYREERLEVWNADMSFIACSTLDCTVEDPTLKPFCVNAKEMSPFLKKMNGDIIMYLNDTIQIQTQTGETSLTLSLINEHPNFGSINTIMGMKLPFAPSIEPVSGELPSFNKTQFESGILINHKEFSEAINMCENINTGIYLLNHKENQLTISSGNITKNYAKILELETQTGDGSTVAFSAPIHKFFDEDFFLFMKDEFPLFLSNENRFLVRVPHIE